jgi:hypothetical protein
MTQGRGRRTDPDVRQAIEALAGQGWSTARMIALLDADSRYADRVPAVRTVQAIASPHRRSARPGTPWTFLDADPDDARLLLPMLAQLQRRGVPWVTGDVAAWLVRIARAAPGVDPGAALLAAVRYLTCARDGTPADQADQALVSLLD